MKQVIVVGAGNWGKNLVRNFYELGALAGVAELDPTLREQMITTYPEIAIYETLESALKTEISAFVIATPAPTHYEIAKTLLVAGKDIFVEKPLTLETATAKELTALAKKQKNILMVGHLLLYQNAIAWMRDYLATGKAGNVWHVATTRVKLGRVRQQENVWWSFAPHDVSVVLDLLGYPTLETIQAKGQGMLQPDIADNVHVDLSFTSGQTAHLHCSWYWPELKRQTVVIAQKQMLVYDEVAKTVTVYDKTVDEQLQNQDQGSWEVSLSEMQPLKRECEHFLNCLETRKQPYSDGENGVAVVEILEKAQEAMGE
ncbi:MAG: Gfo/Idh/MocA family protein [Halothece sp.]